MQKSQACLCTLSLGAFAILAGCAGGPSVTSVAPAVQQQQLLLRLGTQTSGVMRTAGAPTNPAFQVIYKFLGGDSQQPYSSALAYANGVFYGTTFGNFNNKKCGTVFSLTPNANFTLFTEAVLHTFTSGTDGCYPEGGVIVVGSTLYGTTNAGGTSNFGIVFALPISGGAETVLHTFTGGVDGADPEAGLINVGSNLYGTTWFGTVFSEPLRGGPMTTLYQFHGQNDGGAPSALINVGQYLYGTTEYGGANGFYKGTVFRVPLAGGPDTILYSFDNGLDGGLPLAGLISVGSALYGTTSQGGTTDNGTVFSVPIGGGSESVLHSFTDEPDGAYPTNPLTLINGKLYGMTDYGGGGAVGAGGDGIIFSLAPSGGSYTIVHKFGGRASESGPLGALVAIGGNIYGMTASGGNGFGTAFKCLSP